METYTDQWLAMLSNLAYGVANSADPSGLHQMAERLAKIEQFVDEFSRRGHGEGGNAPEKGA